MRLRPASPLQLPRTRRTPTFRRALALLQLLLFVLSTSTLLLPCAHRHADARASATISHDMTSHDMSSHDMHSHDITSHESSSRRGSPSSPSAACPWVVGCVGMLQFHLDASWRSVESSVPSATPNGVTLRYVGVDRDIESPPPRA